jgi:hypothetical protein
MSARHPYYVCAFPHSRRHRAEVLASQTCACFHCQTFFAPERIIEWTDAGETALCPHCAIDAVLGSASGYPLTLGLLKRMHRHWFEGT